MQQTHPCVSISHLHCVCVCLQLSSSKWFHLDKYVEAQTVDVVDVAQSKQAGEQATCQHAHSQVQANGQTLPNDATTRTHSDDIMVSTVPQGGLDFSKAK